MNPLFCSLPPLSCNLRWRSLRTLLLVLVALPVFSLELFGREHNVINIEAAMRVSNERASMVGSMRGYWPDRSDGARPAHSPEDCFYGEDLLDPEKAAVLVRELRSHMRQYVGRFIESPADGRISRAGTGRVFNVDDIPTPTPENYVEVFRQLVDILNRLNVTYLSGRVGTPLGGGITEYRGSSYREDTCGAAKMVAVADFSKYRTHQVGSIYKSEFMRRYEWDGEFTYTGRLTATKSRFYYDLTDYTGTAVHGTAVDVVNSPFGRWELGRFSYSERARTGGIWYSNTYGWEPGNVEMEIDCPPDNSFPGYRRIASYRGLLVIYPEWEHFVGDAVVEFDCCAPCPDGDCAPGQTSFALRSVDVTIGLGGGESGSGGSLQIRAEEPSPDLASPSALRPRLLGGARAVFDSTRARGGTEPPLVQVRAGGAVADIQELSNAAYEVRFFYNSQVSGIDGKGRAQLEGDPYRTVRVENPDEAEGRYNRLWVTDIGESGISRAEYEYVEASNKWVLVTDIDGVVQTEIRRSEYVDEEKEIRIETYIIKDAEEEVVYQEKTTFRQFPWNKGPNALNQEEVLRKVIDPEGEMLKTTYEYYQDEETDGPNYGQLKLQVEPDGFWRRYEYDGPGQVAKVISPLGNSAPDAVAGVRATVTKRSDTAPHETIVEKVILEDGTEREIGRHYRVMEPDSGVQSIEAHEPGAAWDADENLVTTRAHYLQGDHRGRVKSEVRSVGEDYFRGKFWEYEQAGDLLVTTTHEGVPNEELDGVKKGTRTVTATGETGAKVSEDVYDIETNTRLSSWIATDFDELGRVERIEHDDGTEVLRSYACCGLEFEVDREGIRTDFTHQRGHVRTETRGGVTTRYVRNHAGRPTKVYRSPDGGAEKVLREVKYRMDGDVKKVTEYGMHTTRFQREALETGATRKTTTYPDGGTQVRTFARDGSLLSVRGTAVAPVDFEYDFSPSGDEMTTEIRIGETTNEEGEVVQTRSETVTTYRNFLGQEYLLEFSDGARQESSFDNRGRLQWTKDPDGVVAYFTYDALGQQKEKATLLSGDRNDPKNPIDFAGKDRITRTTRQYTEREGEPVRREETYVWLEKGVDSPTRARLVDRALNGREYWVVEGEAKTHRVIELPTDEGSDLQPGEKRVTTVFPDESESVELYRDGRPVEKEHRSASGEVITGTKLQYDPLGRIEHEIRQPGGETTTFTYWEDDELRSITTPDPDPDLDGPGWEAQTTEWIHTLHPEGRPGRKTVTKLPDGSEKAEVFSPRGLLIRSHGDGTYPVEYEYGPQGRMRKMTTWQEFDSASGSGSGGATTEWRYDTRRGWLQSKHYEGQSTAAMTYDYWPSGRLRERVSRGGVETRYRYNDAGDLERVTYSGETPEVEIRYNRRGLRRMVKQTGANGVLSRRDFRYNNRGMIKTEQWEAGPLDGFSTRFHYDSLHRFEGISLEQNDTRILEHDYGYKPGSSRIRHATDRSTGGNPARAEFGYDAGSRFLGNTDLFGDDEAVMTIDRKRDAIKRLRSVESPVASFNYDFDDRNRRVRIERESGEQWRFGRDTLGQVNSARRHLENGEPKLGYHFEYEHDAIGNRTAVTRNNHTVDYTPNPLNQYQERETDRVHVLGKANPEATVTVNREPVLRQRELFYKGLELDNEESDVYETVKVTGVKTVDGDEPENYVSTVEREVFLPQRREAFAYDRDGNLRQDGRWTYEWDGENRLTAMETRADLASDLPRERLEFLYCADGRRIGKKVYDWDSGASSFSLRETVHFLYAGWNLLAETTGTGELTRSYLWSPSENGQLELTATPGALLGFRKHATGEFYFTQADGNGNVAALISAADGSEAARYEYGPFGEPLLATGPMAEENPMRFSSRYTDTETGLLYYGFRYYSPSLGRWLNRDPIEELGGLNLYGFVGNDPIDFVDFLGLSRTADVASYLAEIATAKEKFSDCCNMPPFLNCLAEEVIGDEERVPETLSNVKEMVDAWGILRSLSTDEPDLEEFLESFGQSDFFDGEMAAITYKYLKRGGKIAKHSSKVLDITSAAVSGDRVLLGLTVLSSYGPRGINSVVRFNLEGYKTAIEMIDDLKFQDGDGTMRGKLIHANNLYNPDECIDVEIHMGTGYGTPANCAAKYLK